MKYLLLCLFVISFVGISGCIGDMNENTDVTNGIDDDEMENNGTGTEIQVEGMEIEIVSGDLTYPVYIAAPSTGDRKPAIVLIHSFNGLEPGYMDLTDQLASEGYVVISPRWQTFETSPDDATVAQLIRDSVDYMANRSDVNIASLGLTGFCAGGRYTMLFLPEIDDFVSGVAWYGFPYSGGEEHRPDRPVDVLEELDVPMLIIHGTSDQASNISNIYSYAAELDAAGKYFELKVYQGQPHGFVLEESQLSRSFEAEDAYWQMVTFFDRTLK
ncbi:dienelactone hydrolase family protein [Methanolobus psychrotolerans]|uniref:dienelactone hydrolase family protein n=1 Tax=Methanolobus psychrotolerans TaxID=1874706 RepID=UPI000B91A78C|nr:dienelactone hydrolase family protein [Methanolobus psychrotolerans]